MAYDLTYTVLEAYARRQFADRVGTKADTEINEAINDAFAMIAKERRWPWYLSPGYITTAASYSTGTLTATNGSAVVTLSGGTFPTYAASGELSVSGQWYTISTRDSGTQITLATAFTGTTVAATTGTWLVYQDAYTLPSDCMNFHRPLYGKTSAFKPTAASYEQLLELKSDTQTSQSNPAIYCIRKNTIMFAPAPSSAAVVNFCYYRKPATLSSGGTADWDSQHVDLAFRAIDHQLSLRGPCQAGNPGQTLQAYKQLVANVVPNDKSDTERDSPLRSPWRYNRDPSIPAS